MARSNRWVMGLIVLSLSLTITIIPPVKSQSPSSTTYYKPPVGTVMPQEDEPTKSASTSSMCCRVYALGELCDDSNMCKWISETVPQVIEPGTWGQGETGKPVLTYYALGKTIVVYHTPDTQKKVEAFLGNLKKAMPMPKEGQPVPTGKLPGKNQGVVPAQYSTPSVIQTGDSTPLPANYPVPAQAKPPKHLFHFIIRYEGDGIIDSNVVDFMKVQMGQKWNNTPVTGYDPSGPVGPACCPSTTVPSGSYIQKTPASTSGPSMSATPAGFSPALPAGMYLANPPMYANGVPTGLAPMVPPSPMPPGNPSFPGNLPITQPTSSPSPGQIQRPSRVNNASQPFSSQPFIY